MEEDGLHSAKGCVILDPPLCGAVIVASEEVVHVEEKLVNVDLRKDLGELTCQLPEALERKEETDKEVHSHRGTAESGKLHTLDHCSTDF